MKKVFSLQDGAKILELFGMCAFPALALNYSIFNAWSAEIWKMLIGYIVFIVVSTFVIFYFMNTSVTSYIERLWPQTNVAEYIMSLQKLRSAKARIRLTVNLLKLPQFKILFLSVFVVFFMVVGFVGAYP